MKTLNYYLLCLFAFTYANNVLSQNVCNNPPFCIQNSTINGGGTSGVLNSSPGSTVPSWFRSHGTPDYRSGGTGTLWLWSKNNFPSGEGVFTCYNFLPNHTYRVCVSARWDNGPGNQAQWWQSGTMNVLASNGLTPNSATTTSQTTIGTTNITGNTFATFLYNFTPGTTAYNQLWIYPTLPAPAVQGNQFNLEIDDIVVKDVTQPTITSTNNGSSTTYTLTGGPATGGVWNWSTVPASVTGTGNNFTVPNPTSGSTIVVATYVDPCIGGCGGLLTVRNILETPPGPLCSDTCYWKVTGNNIIGGNNIFGTLTPDDVEIQTSGFPRGIITSTGEWGMGQGAAVTPNARLHVDNSTWGLGHIDASGLHPSVRLYQTSPTSGGPTARLGLATSAGDWTANSSVGDVILQNMSQENSLIFGTNVNASNTNGLERMRIDESGQVGINMPNSSSAYNPTAYLHVACQGGNDDRGNIISDVRFERLEPGRGTLLVIDDNGYVYNSGETYTPGGGINNSCNILNYIPKVSSTTGDLMCSQIFDNGTNVGIGNTVPAYKFHIGNNTANSPALMLDGNWSTTTPSTHGRMYFNDQNFGIGAGNFGSGGDDDMYLWTYGSTNRDIRFMTTTSGSTSPTSASWSTNMIIKNNGSVGIGTTGPFNYTWTGGLTGSTLPPTSGTLKLDVNGVTRSLAFIATSDENLKTNIQRIDNANEIISGLKGTTYNWKDETLQETGADNSKQYGFIAQEVAKVIPEAVVVDGKGKYGINYNSFIPILVESQKETNEKLEEEREKNQQLAEQVNELSKKLEELASKLEKLDGSTLDQDQSEFKIFPNPNSGNFMVKHFIPMNTQSAYLLITDQNGKELMKKEISCVGLCTSNINLNANIDNGTYSCTLFINGKIVTSDRFVYTK